MTYIWQGIACFVFFPGLGLKLVGEALSDLGGWLMDRGDDMAKR